MKQNLPFSNHRCIIIYGTFCLVPYSSAQPRWMMVNTTQLNKFNQFTFLLGIPTCLALTFSVSEKQLCNFWRKTSTIYKNIFTSKFICNYNQIPLLFFCEIINAATTHLVLMEGKYAMSDDFFPPLSLRLQMLIFLKYSYQSHKQGLIYSIQSLLSQKHPQAVRSFLSMGLQRNKFEFRAKRMSSLDHISH